MLPSHLKLSAIVSKPFGENTFVANLDGRSDCLVVDPGLEPGKIIAQLERKNLQAQIQALSAAPGNSAALEQARRELAEANSRLTQQTQLAARLAQEKQTLEARLKSSSADADVVAALRAENQILRQQLAQSRTPPTKGGKNDDSGRQLAAARAEIATLQSDKDILRLEKIALENRVKQLSGGMLASSKPASGPATPVAGMVAGSVPNLAASVPNRAEDSARIFSATSPEVLMCGVTSRITPTGL